MINLSCFEMKKAPFHNESKFTSTHLEDDNPFRDAMKGVQPLKQDKINISAKQRLQEKQKKAKFSSSQKASQKQLDALFTFSDMYEAKLPSTGPIRYCKEGVPSHVLKQLRRGDFTPEILLDLHGLTKEQTKQELAALIFTAQKELVDCVSIMHGHGEGVLKRALPHYLIQHPSVVAFHQAPLEFGGQSALLVLLETPNSQFAFGKE